MGERFVEDRRRALQSYLRCIVNYLVRLVLDIFEASDSLVRLARLVFDIFEAIYFLVRVVFDIFEASKWLLSGDHQRGTVYVPRQSNSSHVSSLLCGCSRQFQQVRSLVKNNPTPAIADNIDTCSNGQAPSLSIFSRRRRSENSQTNQLPNPVLWWQLHQADFLGFSQPFCYKEILNDIWLHFHRCQFACLFVFIVSSELLWISWYYVK